jgi:hypothetical protein
LLLLGYSQKKFIFYFDFIKQLQVFWAAVGGKISVGICFLSKKDKKNQKI